MQISVTQTDYRASYLICAPGILRVILLCGDVAAFQFHLDALTGSKQGKKK